MRTASLAARSVGRANNFRTRDAAIRRAWPTLLLACVPLAGCGSPRNWFHRESSRPLLDVALEDPRPDERRKAAEKLAAGREASTDVVIKAFDTIARTDSDTMVRAAAVRGLGKSANANRVPTLLKLLDSSPEQPIADCKPAAGPVRWEAAIVMERLAAADTIRAADREAVLASLLAHAERDPDRNVKLVATTALACFPERRVPPALVGVLRTNDYALQRRAGESLQRLTGQNFDTDADAWAQWLAGHATDTFAARPPPPAPKDRSWWARLVSSE